MMAYLSSSALALFVLSFFKFLINLSSKRGVGGIFGSTPFDMRYSSTISLIFLLPFDKADDGSPP